MIVRICYQLEGEEVEVTSPQDLVDVNPRKLFVKVLQAAAPTIPAAPVPSVAPQASAIVQPLQPPPQQILSDVVKVV